MWTYFSFWFELRDHRRCIETAFRKIKFHNVSYAVVWASKRIRLLCESEMYVCVVSAIFPLRQAMLNAEHHSITYYHCEYNKKTKKKKTNKNKYYNLTENRAKGNWTFLNISFLSYFSLKWNKKKRMKRNENKMHQMMRSLNFQMVWPP